jgi:short-subunit dehydrogenase
MRNLKGKRALVTGAATGIGRQIALELAARGANLALADINVRELERTAVAARRLSVDVETWRCDISDPLNLDDFADELIDRWAGVDVLVNNAGIVYYGPTHEMPAAEWDRLVDVNFRGHLQMTRRLLPWLLGRPEAHVLNVCSVLGLTPLPRTSVYCATKSAMIGFSNALRGEYGRWGLGVTTLCPGFVDTGFFAAARPTGKQNFQPKHPPKILLVTPEKVARRAVRAIERNQARVIVDPVGHWIRGVMETVPWLFDWFSALGHQKRTARQRAELAELHATGHDEVSALKAYVTSHWAGELPKSSAAAPHSVTKRAA